MPQDNSRPRPTIRFGRDFELDPGLFELRRSGRAVKLERVPMEVLLLLVNERERVVSRQQIADAVWGRGVSLDTDNSINGAIRKLRRALKDDPDHPRYVQTITGRGYRFIAAVEAEETEGSEPRSALAAEPHSALAVESGSAVAAESRSAGAADTRPAEAAAAAVQTAALEATAPATGAPAAPRTRPVRRKFPGPLLLAAAAVLLIAAVSLVVWWRRSAAHTASQRTVRLAVLPFENLTGDPSQEYLSDGFTEELITQLGSLDPQRLAVIARTSVMFYKGAHTPLRRIAQDLGVQYVLEGSVRRDAERVRITAQLIQVRDQTHLWAQEYDRAPEDLLAVQSEIGRQIAEQIRLALDKPRTAGPVERAALSPQEYEAWDAYLKGRYLWTRRTRQDMEDSVGWFRQAIDRDPSYARAWAGLADAWALMSSYGFGPVSRYMPQAREAAERAVALDPSLAEAHTSLALVAENYDWDWQTAEKEYRRALALNANYATAHQWFAECLAFEGRFDEALAESERARALDPLSTIIAADNGAIYYYARQYDRAVARFQSVLDVDPANGRAHLIVDAYTQQGRYQQALDTIQQWRRLGDGPWIWAKLALVYGRSGDRARARQALRKIAASNRPWDLDLTPLLDTAYAGLDDREQRLRVLEGAYRAHGNLPTTFKVDPIYDPLRGDPRFQAMLRGAGLAR